MFTCDVGWALNRIHVYFRESIASYYVYATVYLQFCFNLLCCLVIETSCFKPKPLKEVHKLPSINISACTSAQITARIKSFVVDHNTCVCVCMHACVRLRVCVRVHVRVCIMTTVLKPTYSPRCSRHLVVIIINTNRPRRSRWRVR